jgi:hypothetical protein
VNVQQFYAAGSKDYGPAWWVAWVVDPAIAMFLIAMLVAEQVLSRYQIKSGGWVRALKWGAFAATYAMNTWSAWAQFDIPAIVKHSIPPLLVVLAAEAVTQARHGLSKAIQAAHDQARQRLADRAEPVSGTGSEDRREPVLKTGPETGQRTDAETAETGSQNRAKTAEKTAPKTARKGKPKTREDAVRAAYDAHVEEHGRPISADKLVEQVRAAGHRLGKATALRILADLNNPPTLTAVK